MTTTSEVGQRDREELLTGIPVSERRLQLAGVSTAVLGGGDGPPMVLLHGPSEFALVWLQVLPQLVRTHRVIVPDLPGHGASAIPDIGVDADWVLGWLGELVEETCPTPPVLVDALGLSAFEPAPRFGLAMQRFLSQPTAGSYDRFMDFCAFDLDLVRERWGQRWAAYAAYAVELASTPRVQVAMGDLIGQFAATPIPPAELARINVPTTLIWGRYDLATPVEIAEAVGARYGWPLHVIEDAGDDPPLEQPAAFLVALRAAIGTATADPISEAVAS
jgi:pimeloyl-ACP methyl ester carboxylesterase